MYETPLKYQYTLLKNEEQEGKTGPFQEWVLTGVEWT
jgi:hypothetical protein